MMSNSSHGVASDTGRSLLILWGSETGNAQDAAERIGREAQRRNFTVRAMEMDAYPLADLIEEPIVIFICSTTGNGTEPRNMSNLWRNLIRSDLPGDLLDSMDFAVFGLGDSSYERFNWAAKKLQRRLENLSARELVARGDADDQDYLGVDGTLNPWIESLFSALDDLYPPTREFEAPPPTDIPPPKARLTAHPSNPPPNGSKNEERSEFVNVTMTQNSRITADEWYQDVRHIEFKADHKLDYEPGDVAVLYPENTPEDVESLASRMGWTRILENAYSIEATDPGWPLPREFPTQVTLKQLLDRYLDIAAVPRRSFFQTIRHFATDEREREKLEEFCSSEGQEELFTYCNRPRRTIIEVLAEFRSVKIPLEYILDAFPAIRPRQFSIASSSTACPDAVQLCVAIVKYKSGLKIPRKGLCTSWLARMSIGTQLSIRLEHGTMALPLEYSKPVILIGPGTGVAPMRAFVQRRIHEGAKDNLLYFGCRSVKTDYHYREEWSKLSKDGDLIFRVAASRDQDRKVYVQHLIPDDAELLWNWIVSREASVFISGSSNNMPKSVRKAIIQALCIGGGWDEEKSVQYVQGMELNGRWGEECWS